MTEKTQKHHLVVEYSPIIEELQGYAVVVKTRNFDRVNEINHFVNIKNKLHCIVIHYEGKLSTFPVQQSWENIPIHLFVREMGRFEDLVPRLMLFRSLNIRIFFNSDIIENYTSIQILASLGIDCGISFTNRVADWEALNDLLHYAAYSKVKRASIEPFNYLLSQYNPTGHTDIRNVYFNNPQRYLHLDPQGRVALTDNHLKKQSFIGENLNEIDTIINSEEYLNETTKFKDDFLSLEGCSSCPSWRICLGFFKSFTDESSRDVNSNCQKFMEEMMEACDFYHTQKNSVKSKKLCQL